MIQLKSNRHLNSYLIWIVVLVIMIIALSMFRDGAEDYTKNAFLKDLGEAMATYVSTIAIYLAYLSIFCPDI